ncbi:LysR family transcriptional regulator [Verminephrobacter eiseniae]|uniref:Transcriptional regulator, LysR family n=1 Tax=Verminephrobacter eiseniae (strain EF01-2) TaxID=391735 RepID=A1WRX4_VEREI|nr:LysR family transcriptional regulator [Verminephrobacter eiseniae]ABM60381.1 transcriptional regulator, LysR family [Verminephrobacter eiseniae EF01-2]
MNDEPTNDYPDWGLLGAWVAVVESESVSHAARRLGLSQAAVSMRVKMLEGKLGTDLLDRGTRPAKVTLAGQRLYETSTELLKGADEMLENVRGISRARRSVVRLGCVDSFAAAVGPVLYRALSSTTQQVRLWSGLTPSLTSQFVNRQLDLMITTATSMAGSGVGHTPIFTEQYVLVMPRDYAFDAFCSFSDLGRKLPLIRYSARSTIGDDIDAFLARHGDQLERTCEFDTTDPLLSLVAAGLGFAITTPMCLWQSRHFAPELRMVPLESLRIKGRPYGLLKRSFSVLLSVLPRRRARQAAEGSREPHAHRDGGPDCSRDGGSAGPAAGDAVHARGNGFAGQAFLDGNQHRKRS